MIKSVGVVVTKLFNALTLWASAKALVLFTGAILSVVLVVGIVTADVGELKLSWKLHDLESVEVINGNTTKE